MNSNDKPPQNTNDDLTWLSGGGEMGALIRSIDWSQTSLGSLETWPQSLRTSVSLCLSSTFPILICWGPDDIQLYNDSYRPICGDLHPKSMGMPFKVCWEAALPVVGVQFDQAHLGEGTYINNQRMFLERYGYLEETWMTFSFGPIRDESGPFVQAAKMSEEPASAQKPKAEAVSLPGVRVLVAEDVPDNQILMRLYIQSAGGTIELASNGVEAIEKAMSRTYDLVLMDMQMPIMDGLTATKELRKRGYQKPIVALTAHAMPEEIARSLKAGCNTHLIKPISKSDLLLAIKKLTLSRQLLEP